VESFIRRDAGAPNNGTQQSEPRRNKDNVCIGKVTASVQFFILLYFFCNKKIKKAQKPEKIQHPPLLSINIFNYSPLSLKILNGVPSI
jgi:hypothetical protein